MDKYRKQQRKREIEKNKERRKEARAVAAQSKDLSELQAERERLEKAKNAPQIPGQRVRVDKIDEKLTWLAKQIDSKRASDARDREAGLTPRSAKPRGPTSTAYAVGAEQYYKPEDSVYWHPTLNPTGRPPAGKPQKWKAGIVVDERASASGQALPSAAAAASDSDSDSDSDAMPPPPGPPPGFELVIPALPVKDDAIAAAKADTNDEDEPLPPPSPPDHEDEPLPPPPVPAGDEDGSDSEALPPPPMPPPADERRCRSGSGATARYGDDDCGAPRAGGIDAARCSGAETTAAATNTWRRWFLRRRSSGSTKTAARSGDIYEERCADGDAHRSRRTQRETESTRSRERSREPAGGTQCKTTTRCNWTSD